MNMWNNERGLSVKNKCEEDVLSLIPPDVIDYLISQGFAWKEMPFYNSCGEILTPQYRNYLDKMPCYARFVKSRMGGNYGTTDLYVCVDGCTVKKFQYYGDTSAEITKIGEYSDINELSKLITEVQ